MAVNQEVYTLETAQSETVKSTDRILDFDLSAELNHGVVVSNLAYAVAVEMGLDEEFCYQMAIAGMLHDIGKLKLTGYINGQERDPLLIEELKYVRMHSSLGYEELKDQCISALTVSVLFSVFISSSALVCAPSDMSSATPSSNAAPLSSNPLMDAVI